MRRDHDDPYLRLSPTEVAVSWPSGSVDAPPAPVPGPGGALQALGRTVRDALLAGPTFVLFSGGRDSSAVLATAVDVARREGLALPVPVTAVFPGVPDTDESAWQALVLDHLGLRERVVVTLGARSQRWLGADARDSLARRGLLWPPALHLNDRVLEQVSGGRLLTGEGGDEVLGLRRVTPAYLLLRVGVRPTRRVLRAALDSAVPLAGRSLGVHVRERVRPGAPWLVGDARRAAAAAQVAALPRHWDWAAATRDLLRRRAIAVFERNYAQVAREHGVVLHHPLRDPAFVHALADDGGRWGFQGRTHLMHVLFRELLPAAVVRRETKAFFDAARFGPEERQFAAAWDGTGVDHALVDAAALRRHWLGERPSSTTALLLHQAWLAVEGSGR